MWPNPQFPAYLVTFTEEIFNGKLFFYAVYRITYKIVGWPREEFNTFLVN